MFVMVSVMVKSVSEGGSASYADCISVSRGSSVSQTVSMPVVATLRKFILHSLLHCDVLKRGTVGTTHEF